MIPEQLQKPPENKMVCSNCLIYCLVHSYSWLLGVLNPPEYNLLWLPVIWFNPSLPPMIPEQLQKPPENKMVCSNCLIYCLVHSYSWLLGVLNSPEYNLLWLPVIWSNPSLPPMIPEQLRKAPENKMVCSNWLMYCLVCSHSRPPGVPESPEYNLLWLPVIWSNSSLPLMIPEQLQKAPENKMVCSNWLIYCLVHSYSWILEVLNSPEYNLLWLPAIWSNSSLPPMILEQLRKAPENKMVCSNWLIYCLLLVASHDPGITPELWEATSSRIR